MCTVRLRHKGKIARCKFFLVAEEVPALLEIAGLLEIMCEVVKGQQTDRKFNSKRMKLCSAPSHKANTD